MTPRTLAVIGGTGDLGRGLARRWAKAGHAIIIGSRDAARADRAAREMTAAVADTRVTGAGNRDAAAAAEIVALAVPYATHRAMLEELREALAGKILIDTTVPLMPPKVMRVQLPPDGSAAKAAQAFLGGGVRVVSAFHNIAADHLGHEDRPIDCDVLVTGDDPKAREVVIGLAQDLGLRAWHAGPIDNSAAAEALSSVLIFLNRHYKLEGAGIRITGTPGG